MIICSLHAQETPYARVCINNLHIRDTKIVFLCNYACEIVCESCKLSHCYTCDKTLNLKNGYYIRDGKLRDRKSFFTRIAIEARYTGYIAVFIMLHK